MQGKEEVVVVLDFLPNGYPFDKRPGHMKTPVAQAIGKNRFMLLELTPKKGVFLQPYQEAYIGDGKREESHHINGKMEFDKMTSTARSELSYVIKEIVQKNEERFVRFFNEARSMTTRMHQLELLPGLGKKHMWEIIEERDVEPFKTYVDIKKRVKLMPDPEKAIVKRILKEIEGLEKHKIFVD